MFAPQIEEGAKPTSVEQGTPLQHETSMYEEEHDFDLVEFEASDEHENLERIIKDKDALIKELQDNLAKENFIISFLEQENHQFKEKNCL